MSYHAVGLTDEELNARFDQILKNQKTEANNRKFALAIGAIGALIAAARLGIVAIPMVKAARARPASK
jgi:hypothetical protein